MDHGPLSMVAGKFQWVFSESLLNACGKDAKFCRRERIITPFRLGLALTATCASQRVETLADLSRGFNALFGTTVTSKAFYNQMAKPHFADFARTMTARLISDMTLKVLGFAQGHAFAALRHLVMQDGSSFAIHASLREVFPGRFKAVKPAAGALHTTLALLCDAPTTGVLTPDTTSDQAFLPEPTARRDRLLLADRGYIAFHSLRRVQDAGGVFLIRAKAGMNPPVLDAFREDGKRWRSRRHQALQTLHANLPKRPRVARRVQGHVDGAPLCLRLSLSWKRRTKRCCSFLTNLSSQRDPLEGICRAYQWRWPVELLCKEGQSSAKLHAFDTENPASVEGLMWTAIAAAALKRFLAHMTHLLLEVPMATRKVALCAVHALGGMGQALKIGDGAGLYAALEAAITSLACHAQRAHPKRDRHTGRSQLGLEPCFDHDDMIEFAKAA
jgi:hypothetical protein